MHDIEPFYNWQRYYEGYKDPKNPFFEKETGSVYTNTVYGYYIDPNWDEIGSETLYLKILMINYQKKYLAKKYRFEADFKAPAKQCWYLKFNFREDKGDARLMPESYEEFIFID